MASLRRVLRVFKSAYYQVNVTRTFSARKNVFTSVSALRSQTLINRIGHSSVQCDDATKFQGHRSLLNLVRWYGSHYEKWTDLAYEDLVALVNDEDIQLIDVREEKEIKEQGAFPRAVNIPLGDLKESLKMDDDKFKEKYNIRKPQESDTDIVFVGFQSVKSSAALEIAHKMGYKKSRQYPGGYDEWKKKQTPS